MKKVLIITYYWPPAGGIGVQRIAKFCKYLPECGWEPIVLTVNSENYERKDTSLLSDIKNISNIYRTTSLEPHIIYNFFDTHLRGKTKVKPTTRKIKRSRFRYFAEYIRLNLFIPDTRIGWLYNGYRRGKQLIQEHKPDLIFSTAPPYTPHLLALKLHKASSTPWIADFRDPWIENTVYNTVKRLKLAISINRYLEKRVLTNASALTFTGPQLKDLYMRNTGRHHEAKAHVITNGYDPEDWLNRQNKQTEQFYITYFGSLYKQRFHSRFFIVLGKLINSNPTLKEKLSLRFIGTIDDELKTYISKHIPKKNLKISDYVPYKEAIELLLQPQLLLLIIDNVPFNETITLGKVFDYLPTRNPILGIGPLNCDTANIIRETNTGYFFDYDDDIGVKKYILDAFNNWQTNNLSLKKRNLESFYRRELTKKLSQIFNKVTG